MGVKLRDEGSLVELVSHRKRPCVLLFDSGVGGLSVYDEVRRLLPDAHYIYVFDNEAFPYGEKPESFIVRRVVDIVAAAASHYPLALVIIACNTASTVTLPALRSHFDFPVVGVVPAIKPAARLTRNGIVGLLATRATVRRPYTQELIAQFATECKTEMLGSAELVTMAEDKLHGRTVSVEKIKHILQPWLQMAEPPDTVVLGCTHFPLLKAELKEVLPEGTRLVDSGAAIARRTVWLLENQQLTATSTAQNTALCTRLTPEIAQLMPVLMRYGFEKLEILPLRTISE